MLGIKHVVVCVSENNQRWDGVMWLDEKQYHCYYPKVYYYFPKTGHPEVFYSFYTINNIYVFKLTNGTLW